MSLLWTNAAWWNNQRDFEYEGDDEYPLRDPSESMGDRRRRYVDRIVEGHGVSRDKAEGALRHVHGHMHRDSPYADSHEYGFAGITPGFRGAVIDKLRDPKTWENHDVEPVPLKGVHASQNWIRPHSVAHNLFHPGQREATEHEAVGDPDYEPESDEERDDCGLDRIAGHDMGKHVYFMRRHSGELAVVDGHHRVATDMLLGKTHTPARMIHESEVDVKPSHIPSPQSRQEMREHLRADHGGRMPVHDEDVSHMHWSQHEYEDTSHHHDEGDDW